MTASRSAGAGIAGAAIFLSLAALASRLLGFLRDALIAAQLGASAETDAYHASFLLPDLLSYLLLGGALSLAFQPLFSERMARGDDAAAWRLFSNVAAITAVAVIAATCIAFVAAPAFVAFAFAFDEATSARVVELTRIALVGPLFFALGGLLSATEQQRRRFWPGALGGLVYNGAIIAGGLLLAPTLGVAGFTIGVAAGAVLGPFLLPAIAARDRVRFAPARPWFNAEVREYFVLALPLMLGVSLAFGDEWIGRIMASSLGEGEVTRLNNARRLLMLPVAFVGQAAGVAALPWLADLVARKERAVLVATVRASVETTAMVATIAVGGLVALARPIVELVYGRGAYSTADVTTTTLLLIAMAPAAVGWSTQMVLTRVSYAHKDTLRPMLLGTALLMASVPLYWAGAQWRGSIGLAAATAVAFTVSLPAYMLLVRRTTGIPTGWPAVSGVLRGLVIGGAAAAAAWASSDALGTAPAKIAAGVASFGLVALPMMWLAGGAGGRRAASGIVRKVLRRRRQ